MKELRDKIFLWVDKWNAIGERTYLNKRYVVRMMTLLEYIVDDMGGVMFYTYVKTKVGKSIRIKSIFIDPDVGGKGIGERLLGALIKICMESNIKEILWNIRVEDVGFCPWAEKMGFERGERKESKGVKVSYIEHKMRLK